MSNLVSLYRWAVVLVVATPGALVLAQGQPLPARPVARESSSRMDTERTNRIVELQRSIPLWDRLEDVHALSPRVGGAELKKLYAFLASTARPAGLESHQVWALKNDLLNALREQASPSLEDYQGVLLAIYRNPDQDTVMRDYAIQHARPWYPLSANKHEVLELLWTATGQASESLSGTALLSLWGVWMDFPDAVDIRRVGARALGIAGDSRAHIDARISALQLCGQLSVVEALPLAKDVVGKGPAQLRLSAVATLGDLGDESTAGWLRAFAANKEQDASIGNAAEAATNKIAKRFGN